MIDISFKVQWLDAFSEWRVIGSNGHYTSAKMIGEIPGAIQVMLRREGRCLLLLAEGDQHHAK